MSTAKNSAHEDGFPQLPSEDLFAHAATAHLEKAAAALEPADVPLEPAPPAWRPLELATAAGTPSASICPTVGHPYSMGTCESGVVRHR